MVRIRHARKSDIDGYVIHDPAKEDVAFALLDTARWKAARRSERLPAGEMMLVLHRAPDENFDRVRAVARAGLVWWYRTCGWCGGRGCSSCSGLGAVEDEQPPERAHDGV